MHKSVGHLGIFVSGQVAKREHTQIVDLIEYIEHLPPGLYGMQIEEQKTNGSVRYDVMLTERRVEDLQVLQKYGRKDEVPFEAVEATSETLASAYETFVHPVVSRDGDAHRRGREAGLPSAAGAALGGVGSQPVPVAAQGHGRHGEGEPGAARRRRSDGGDGALDRRHDLRLAGSLSRPARCRGREHVLPHLWPGQHRHGRRREGSCRGGARRRARTPRWSRRRCRISRKATATKAIVRAALLLMKAGTGRRRLSAMKRARDLVGKDIGLLDMPAEAAREIIREQSYIVDFEPVKALVALPKLLRTSEDRRRLLDLLDRLEGQIEANAKQVTLLGEIRRLLSEMAWKARRRLSRSRYARWRTGRRSPEAVARPGAARRSGDTRRTRASS